MTMARFSSALVLAMMASNVGFGAARGGRNTDPPRNIDYFRRVSVFLVCEQIDDDCNDDTETVAESLAVSSDGNTLVYTDSARVAVGFVDISTPSAPVGLGVIEENAPNADPKGVDTCGDIAIAVFSDTGVLGFLNPSGFYVMYNITARSEIRRGNLDGTPDSIAFNVGCTKAVVTLENEGDPTVNSVGTPQLPAGRIAILTIAGTAVTVNTIAIPNLGYDIGSDPQPDDVDIRSDGTAAVTLQENNAVLLINVTAGGIIGYFDAGTVNLEEIDISDDSFILQDESFSNVKRQPEGITWIRDTFIATADEGAPTFLDDIVGVIADPTRRGARTFTIFDEAGNVQYSSGNELEHLAVSVGHYNDATSGGQGNEPENVLYAEYGNDELLFVLSEKSNLVFVYDVSQVTEPVFLQVLPTGVAPEDAVAIPERNLLAVSCEVDSRDSKIRAGIHIYERGFQTPSYPTLQSIDRRDEEAPIPFSALSGLAEGPRGSIFAIADSAYRKNRILEIDVTKDIAVPTVIREIFITDPDRELGVLPALLVNPEDDTVNLDLEGITPLKGNRGFWLVSESRLPTLDDLDTALPNLLIRVDRFGVITKVVELPVDVAPRATSNGFEGVARAGRSVYVAFQRALTGDANPLIGEWTRGFPNGSWRFFEYPLDAPESQNGGWVGISELVAIARGYFLVLERDNQGGPDGVIKKIYLISLNDVVSEGDRPVFNKYFVYDLREDLLGATNGVLPEKIEGMTKDANNKLWIVTDNDGLNGSSGETLLLKLGELTLDLSVTGECREVCIDTSCQPCSSD